MAAYSRLGAPVLLPVVPDQGRELDWGFSTGDLRPGPYGLLEPVVPCSGQAGLVTVLFDDELLDDVPREPHDQPLTAVVTPAGGWEQLRPRLER